MSAHPCRVCGQLRKVDIVFDYGGWQQPSCVHCGDPGYYEPFKTPPPQEPTYFEAGAKFMSSKEDHRVIFQKLEDLPVELDGKDPDPVSMMLNATDVIAEGDWFVHSKVRELVEANPQFTRPHISVDENSVTHAVKIILSQGPTMQPKGD